MGQSVSFGIVGGYGATGRVVVSEVLKSCDGELLVGGRDPAKLKSLATEFGSRVSATRLDVLEAHSLDEFSSRCSIIVNCGGPVMLLQDRVAQAALRRRCHYIDPAGMSVVKERLLPHKREIADLGLSFVVSAGWMPGISEYLPHYANVQAGTRMDAIESVTVYFGDSGEWSRTALRDGVWYIRQSGLRRPGYFRRGEWTRTKTSAAFRTINLGSPVGPGRFCMFFTAELNEIGQRLKDCDVSAYTYLSGFRTILATTAMALLPLPEALGVRLLRNVFRRNRRRVGGFVMVHVVGQSEGRRAALRVRIVYEAGRDYWMNGVVLANVARMVSAGKGVHAGVHFLADAVDPMTLMTELRKAGVQQAETFELCE